jgi:Rrf2 family protein
MDSAGQRHLCTAKEIAETYQVPAELLGKVLQSLARASMVESVQGPRGGYRLSSDLSTMTLGEVVHQLDGPVRIVPCCDGDAICRQEPLCNIRNPIQKIQEDVVSYISGLSLARFRRPVAAHPDIGMEFRPR